MQNILRTLREEFEDKLRDMDKTIPREMVFQEIPNKISVFIGMRRTGKTVSLFQKIATLLEKKIPLSQIFYANFEDDRLVTTDHKMLSGLIDAFYSLFPENHDNHCYIFIDEIQSVSDWPLVIRRIFDSKKVSIFLTGSSAKLLSKEIATSLRGRSLATEIWPFSFNEFLLSKNIAFNQSMGKKEYDNYLKILTKYLNSGGFPETLSITTDHQHRILQDYVNAVVMRDIIERYHISNITLIRYMIKSLLRNISSPFTVNKFFNDIKSQGISVSKNTLYEYLQYIEDAYLLFSVPLYAESIRKIQTNPKKIYAIDPGLVQAYQLSSLSNNGHLFENLVYPDLRRNNHEIHYYVTKEGFEVDFLSQDIKGKKYLWQVVWDTSDEKTMQREHRALSSAENELGLKGEIISPKNYLKFVNDFL